MNSRTKIQLEGVLVIEQEDPQKIDNSNGDGIKPSQADVTDYVADMTKELRDLTATYNLSELTDDLDAITKKARILSLQIAVLK